MTYNNSVGYLDSVVWQHLTHSEDDEQFFSSWLTLQAEIVGGVTGGVVVFSASEDERFRPVACWPQGHSPGGALMKAAEQALSRRQGLVRRIADTDVGNGASHTLAFPILVGERVCGVVALSVHRSSDVELHSALRQLQWGSAWLEKYLLLERVDDLSASAESAGDLLEVTAVAADLESFGPACNAALVELGARLQCDRISIGFVRGRHVRMVGISHTANFSRRMNLVRALEYAMEEAVDQQQVLIYPSQESEALVLREHSELARLHGTGGSVVTVPLTCGERILGAITFEFSPSAEPGPLEIDACCAVGGLIGPILESKWQNDRSLPAKVGSSAKQQLVRLFGPGYLGRKLLLTAAAMLTLFFYFAHAPFRIKGDAALEGQVQRIAAAPFDGFIAEAHARAGDRVEAGTLLAQLDDSDLQLEYHAWSSRLAQFERELQKALANADRAQMAVLRAQMAEAQAQQELLQLKIERTRIRAPFDSIVVAGDLSQALGSAIRQGDTLFQLAPLDSYRIVVKVDERDVDPLQKGQQGELVLSALPDRHFPLTIDRITPVTLAEEGGNFFRVEASLVEPETVLRPGMEGVAKIEVGEQRLIWIWTRRLMGWFRLQLWKWTP